MAVPLMLGALRHRAKQAAMRFAGPPRVDATQYVGMLATTSHDTRLRPRNGARATIAVSHLKKNSTGKGRARRPPAPCTTARRWKRGTGLQDEARGSKMTRATRTAHAGGSETLFTGVFEGLRRKFARIPSVGAAERVFARQPPLGKFSAKPASYEAGSACRIQPHLRSNARAVDRSLALKVRYSDSDGPRVHSTLRASTRSRGNVT